MPPTSAQCRSTPARCRCAPRSRPSVMPRSRLGYVPAWRESPPASPSNPDWMVKLAAIRARQGRIPDAIAALQKAWIEGRTGNARAYFDIAQMLEAWGAMGDARRFAEGGMRRLTADNRDELQAGVQ